MNQEMNIMIVGVGGQGTLLASRLLGAAAIAAGYDVKVSEVHGMSQRGGSVVTYVRCAEKVASPIITQGEADIILAFEQLEAARWLPYLKKGGKMIVNTQMMDPMPVITGAMQYPKDIVKKLQSKVNIQPVDALQLAVEAGSEKAVNVVLIGVMAQTTGISEQIWRDAIVNTVPERFRDMNLTAFDKGYHVN